MAEVASAWVAILPSAKGFGSKLDSQISPEVNKSGRSMGSLLGKGLKAGALGAAAGITATLGTALVKGFTRLEGIDQATAKLARPRAAAAGRP